MYSGENNRAPQGSPATVVEGLAPRSLRLKNTGPNMFYEDLPPITTFKDHLRLSGGTWMWNNLYVPVNINWIVTGIEQGTLICVTDGSYDRKKAPKICGAGWIIFCSTAMKYIKGSFAEHSPSASSYRGEVLGMLAIHLFLLAI